MRCLNGDEVLAAPEPFWEALAPRRECMERPERILRIERDAHLSVLAAGSVVHARQSHVHVAAHDPTSININDVDFIVRAILAHIAALRHEEKSGHRGTNGSRDRFPDPPVTIVECQLLVFVSKVVMRDHVRCVEPALHLPVF